MKLAYIILPFGSSEHLVRCVNSIYRQTADKDDYYVIIAENVSKEAFGDNNVIIIPNDTKETNEKILSAVSLIPQDADHVMFVNVDTVFVPAAFSEFEKHSDSDIIIADSAVKQSNSMLRTNHTANEAVNLRSAIDISDMVISIRLLKGSQADKLLDGAYLHFLLSENIIIKGCSVAVTNKISFYKAYLSVPVSAVEIMRFPHKITEILDIIFESASGQNRLEIYDEYMSIFTECIFSGDEVSDEIKDHAFEAIKKITAIVKNDKIINRLNIINTGCSAEEIEEMDRHSYYLRFKELSSHYNNNNIEMSVQSSIELCMSEQMNTIDKLNSCVIALCNENKLYKTAIDSLSKENSDIKNQLYEVKNKNISVLNESRQIRNDIAALTKNIHFLSQSVEEIGNRNRGPAVISDPVVEIPSIFASGRVGFSVILKSISAWIKFKLNRRSGK